MASGIPVRTVDLARQVAACMGVRDIQVTALGRSFPGDVPRWYADVQKLSSLGFCAKTNLTAGLELTIQSLEASVRTAEAKC